MLIEGIVIVVSVVTGVSIMFAVLQENAKISITGPTRLLLGEVLMYFKKRNSYGIFRFCRA